MKNENETFAVVAFTFVLGYAERALRNTPKTLVHQDGTTEKTESVKRLETTIQMLNSFLDWWDGNE